MIEIKYYRVDADIADLRQFKNCDELNQWLQNMIFVYHENYRIYEINIIEES